MVMIFDRRLLRLGLLMLATAGWFGADPGAATAAAGVCADNGGSFPKECTKEVRVYNNTSGKIWVVLQGSIQLTDAISCPVSSKGGGDVWLQVALNRMDNCLSVKNDYFIFINPSTGIGKGGFASVDVPWWSKRAGNLPSPYIDWWRGARVIIFDDQTAFNELYDLLNKKPAVAIAAGSPVPACNNGMAASACKQLEIYEVPNGVGIDPHLPFQLNEFTFADVCKVESDGTFEKVCVETNPGGFIDFNQNYNVSNVDQVYLPLAMEPVRLPADVGYMGTTMSVRKFRKQLTAFTDADQNPNSPNWPIYNNPVVSGKKMYPNAGIRVPSAQSVLSFYMNPYNFPDGKTPTIIPKNPPKLIDNMMEQWNDCTASAVTSCNADQSALYKSVDVVFLDNYKSYVDSCGNKIPDFLKPVSTNPPEPKLTAYLTFIYGWVPFNVACGNKELPTANDLPPGSRSVINYFAMQYNYETLGDAGKKEKQWFNPYTQLIHDKVKSGGLAASAYAFSIDDHASFLSNSGGTTTGGLIFTVGGPEGLMNGKQHAPPVPSVYQWYDFSIGLGGPAPTGPFWSKYGICTNKANILFPEEEKAGFVLGIDPELESISSKNPCRVTLLDSAGRKYQILVKTAQAPGVNLPQLPIWPAFEPSAGKNFDPDVVGCPSKKGFVAPDQWCDFTNQVSRPATKPKLPGYYTMGARSPLPQ
jgi:hypothetical protein